MASYLETLTRYTIRFPDDFDTFATGGLDDEGEKRLAELMELALVADEPIEDARGFRNAMDARVQLD